MKKIGLCMGVALFLVAMFGYADFVNKNLSEDILRMHFIANSNSLEDQALKEEVRDEVLKQLQMMLPKRYDKKTAVATVLQHSDLILHSAKDTLMKNGCNDAVSLSYEHTYYPSKKYSYLSLPGGEYDGFNLRIGEGKGENWWCVMYPSFGAPAKESIENETVDLIKDELTEEEYELLTSDKPSIVFRFKTVEYFMKIKEKFKSIRSEL